MRRTVLIVACLVAIVPSVAVPASPTIASGTGAPDYPAERPQASEPGSDGEGNGGGQGGMTCCHHG